LHIITNYIFSRFVFFKTSTRVQFDEFIISCLPFIVAILKQSTIRPISLLSIERRLCICNANNSLYYNFMRSYFVSISYNFINNFFLTTAK
jgi:hypothetical protein